MEDLAFGAFHHQKNPEKAIEYLTKALNDSRIIPLVFRIGGILCGIRQDPGNVLLCCSHIEIVKRDVTAPKDL